MAVEAKKRGATKSSRPAALERYRKKRDFSRTSEPASGTAAPSAPGQPRRFVLQKHAASRLHYDLRLEMEGVLRSWAVPKDPPAKPGEKVLAVEVEDHPLDYGDFEGVIPPGNYGAGTVMVWDQGHYLASVEDPAAAYREGQIDFALAGEKCTGNWSLVRMRRGGKDAKDNWLLIKRRDPDAGPPLRAADRQRSVKTGRSMDEITAAARVAPDGRAAATARAGKKRVEPVRQRRKGAGSLPAFLEPMKAKAVSAVPPGSWRLEIKFDGYRALALLGGGEAQLWSRNRKQWVDRFATIREALQQLKCADAILDGEIVALDDEGRPSFQRLQNETGAEAGGLLRYYLFDLLQRDGESLVARPLEQRQAALADLLQGAPAVLQLSPVFNQPPERLLAEVRRRGLEGIIAKAAGSAYEPGRRSGTWIKCRIAHDQELVIGGYTPPQGSRRHLGALLVGYYRGRELIYAGKVGTGFDARKLAELHARFEPLKQDRCPFANLPGARRSRFGQGMTAAVMRTVSWLKPQLVAQIKFAEWTDDGGLRQPVFLGLREDKRARDVVREALA